MALVQAYVDQRRIGILISETNIPTHILETLILLFVIPPLRNHVAHTQDFAERLLGSTAKGMLLPTVGHDIFASRVASPSAFPPP